MIKNALSNMLVKETVLYGLTGVLSKFAPIIIIPIYISYIGLEGFGLLDLYVTIGLAIYIVCEAQSTSGVMRSYYECKENKTLDDLIGSSLSIYLLTYVVLILLYFSLLKAGVCSDVYSYEYLLPIVLVIFPRQIFSLYTIVLRMEHKPKEYIFLSILNVGLTAFLGVMAVAFWESSALSVLYGIGCSQLLIGMLSYFRLSTYITVNLSRKYIKGILWYGVPIAISSLSGWLLASSGRLALAKYASEFDLGVYSLSLKIAMIFMVLLQAFRTAWDPYCMKKFADKDAALTFSKSLNVYWIVSIVFVFIIYFMSPIFILMLGASESILNSHLILLILFGYVWQGAINIIAVGNAWARKTYVNLFGTLTGGLLSLILSILLVQEISVVAGGVGYLIGMMASFSIIYHLAQRSVRIPYDFKIIILMLISSCVYVFYVLIDYGMINLGENW